MADSRSEQDGIGLDQLDEAESGRTDQPLLAGEAMAAGRTRIMFHVGEYVARLGVPVEFAIDDARARHISMESHYEYGSRVGVWRLLRLFERKRVPLTVFAVAMAAERHPDAIRAMVDGGHEIASHGYRTPGSGWAPTISERKASDAGSPWRMQLSAPSS